MRDKGGRALTRGASPRVTASGNDVDALPVDLSFGMRGGTGDGSTPMEANNGSLTSKYHMPSSGRSSYTNRIQGCREPVHSIKIELGSAHLAQWFCGDGRLNCIFHDNPYASSGSFKLQFSSCSSSGHNTRTASGKSKGGDRSPITGFTFYILIYDDLTCDGMQSHVRSSIGMLWNRLLD